MTEKRLLWILLAAWALFWGLSMWTIAFTQPTGDGFTRGLNRVAGFVMWQLAAGVTGVGVWILGRQLPPRSLLRRASLVPVSMFGLLIAAIAALIIFSMVINRPPPPQPDRPVSAPADVVPD